MDEYSRRLHIDADVLYDKYISKILRAAAVAAMTLFSVYVLTGSFGKTLLISVMSGAISLFHTWRRFTEPVSFLLFCAATAVFMGLNADHLRSFAASIRALIAG
jgi:hypothetical protein